MKREELFKKLQKDIDKEITKLNWMIVRDLFFILLILSPIVILVFKIFK